MDGSVGEGGGRVEEEEAEEGGVEGNGWKGRSGWVGVRMEKTGAWRGELPVFISVCQCRAFLFLVSQAHGCCFGTAPLEDCHSSLMKDLILMS